MELSHKILAKIKAPKSLAVRDHVSKKQTKFKEIRKCVT
jgi:hypothetical protein